MFDKIAMDSLRARVATFLVDVITADYRANRESECQNLATAASQPQDRGFLYAHSEVGSTMLLRCLYVDDDVNAFRKQLSQVLMPK